MEIVKIVNKRDGICAVTKVAVKAGEGFAVKSQHFGWQVVVPEIAAELDAEKIFIFSDPETQRSHDTQARREAQLLQKEICGRLGVSPPHEGVARSLTPPSFLQGFEMSCNITLLCPTGRLRNWFLKVKQIERFKDISEVL